MFDKIDFGPFTMRSRIVRRNNASGAYEKLTVAKMLRATSALCIFFLKDNHLQTHARTLKSAISRHKW